MYPPSDGRLLYAHVSLSLSLSFPLRAVLKAPRPRLEIIGKRLGPFIEGKKREEKRERKRKGSRGKREEAEQSYPVQNCFASLIISFPRFPFLYTARRTVFIANCGGAWLKKTSEFVYKGKKEKKRERKRKGARGPHLSSQLAVSPSSPPLPPSSSTRAGADSLAESLRGGDIDFGSLLHASPSRHVDFSESKNRAARGRILSRVAGIDIPRSIRRESPPSHHVLSRERHPRSFACHTIDEKTGMQKNAASLSRLDSALVSAETPRNRARRSIPRAHPRCAAWLT